MIHPLSPDALGSNPELAPLCLLEVAAVVARSALISVHPTLRDLTPDPEHDELDGAASVALGLLALTDGVEDLIAAYLRAVERERQAELRASQQRDF